MYPQDNPYMVKTQMFTTKALEKEFEIEDVQEQPTESGQDLDHEHWQYYELDKSCDHGFWHDTADTIVSHVGLPLSASQENRLQTFVLTIAKHIFHLYSLTEPSFTINRSKNSHVVKVEDKYHVIVRKEQNSIHIFACAAKAAEADGSDLHSWGDEVKKCSREHALGIQERSKDAHVSDLKDSDSEMSFDPSEDGETSSRRQQVVREEKAASAQQRQLGAEAAVGRQRQSEARGRGGATAKGQAGARVARLAANLPVQPAPRQGVPAADGAQEAGMED
jgi:hypothetical protein